MDTLKQQVVTQAVISIFLLLAGFGAFATTTPSATPPPLQASYQAPDPYSLHITSTGTPMYDALPADVRRDMLKRFERCYQQAATAQGKARAAYEFLTALSAQVDFDTRYLRPPRSGQSGKALYVRFPKQTMTRSNGVYATHLIRAADVQQVVPLLQQMVKSGHSMDGQQFAAAQ